MPAAPVLDLLLEPLGVSTVCLAGSDWLIEDGMDTDEPIVATVTSLPLLFGLFSSFASLVSTFEDFP